MKNCLVHDWLITPAGAEKVLEAVYELYPSPVYTLVADRDALKGSILEKAAIHTSFIQRLPWAKKRYRTYLPFFPLAIEQFDLSGYDLIISVSTCVAKGVLRGSGQLHISYCCTPVRYGWELYHQYMREGGLSRNMKGAVAKAVLHYIRMWDMMSAHRVDHFVTLSGYVQKRIRKIYGRDSVVIHPPVDVARLGVCPDKEDFYLTASRLVPYKRVDLIVEAFSRMPDRRLIVIGDGPEMGKIKKKATRNVDILGYQPEEVLTDYMKQARGFVFAACEDFGIVVVEAQACGTPVIAYGVGGARETVIDGRTGLFFHEQTPESIVDAMKRFESMSDGFDTKEIRRNAERFGKERFKEEFSAFVEKRLAEL